ncbi:hypothetical protein D922_01057 [Enterococcus faecalis 06-MB-DW-09]|nr:hypothetical protein D931_00116 [Enterococcus faecium 13.SD.W.09]EPH95947.1 hypothetical protein D922_01057 [Enterococcus faecalis 06-MB-DW-09]
MIKSTLVPLSFYLLYKKGAGRRFLFFLVNKKNRYKSYLKHAVCFDRMFLCF